MKQRKAWRGTTYAQCSARLGRSPQVLHTITQATTVMSQCCGAMVSHAVQRRKPWSVGALTRIHWTIPQWHSVKVWIPTLLVPSQILPFLTTHQRWARLGKQFGNWGMEWMRCWVGRNSTGTAQVCGGASQCLSSLSLRTGVEVRSSSRRVAKGHATTAVATARSCYPFPEKCLPMYCLLDSSHY